MEDKVSYDQPTAAPTPKVAAAGAAGALTILLVYVAQSVFKIEVTAEVASAVTTLVSFLAAYLKKDEKPASAVNIIKGDV